jgi:hypothetical protein
LALSAAAEPVWVAVGRSAGQGQTFVLDRQCYAYTAGHVLRSAGTEVMLTDREGFQARGRAVAVDERLDLGLIKVTDTDGRASKLCKRGAPTMVHLDDALQRFRTSSPDVWLDMVSTPAGGLSRFELDLVPGGVGDERVALATAPQRGSAGEGLSTQSGDSGASIWMTERDTERARYTKDGEANARAATSALLLGVHLGVKDGKAVAVRSDRLHTFIYQTLQPMQWERISVEPSSVKVSDRQRGPFVAAKRDHVLQTSDLQLDRVSFELDLGDRDNRVVGVRAEMGDATPGLTSAGREPLLRVSTSQYRPGEEAGARWDKEACARSAARRPAARARNPLAVECAFASARNARGLRVEFSGNPSALRRLLVIVE